MSEKIDLRKAVREAEQKITGKRFCQKCQTMQSSGNIVGHKTKHWECVLCINRGLIWKRNRHVSNEKP